MKSIEDREKNLLNATDTMAQFYEEIESFLGILFSNMEREGFSVKGERLRSGTFTVKNLTRRLLASVTTIYVKDIGAEDEPPEDDETDEPEEVGFGGFIHNVRNSVGSADRIFAPSRFSGFGPDWPACESSDTLVMT